MVLAAVALYMKSTSSDHTAVQLGSHHRGLICVSASVEAGAPRMTPMLNQVVIQFSSSLSGGRIGQHGFSSVHPVVAKGRPRRLN